MRQVLNPRTNSKLLRNGIVLLICLSVFPACKKKEDDGARVLTVRDMLLGRWQRNLRAKDDNQNYIIDSSEILHARETDTLMLTLVPDATYSRIQRYRGEDFLEHGTWHLQHNDMEVVLAPSTSTTRIDTLKLDTVSQTYFRYHVDTSSIWRWGAFVRP